MDEILWFIVGGNDFDGKLVIVKVFVNLMIVFGLK